MLYRRSLRSFGYFANSKFLLRKTAQDDRLYSIKEKTVQILHGFCYILELNTVIQKSVGVFFINAVLELGIADINLHTLGD